MDSQQNDHQLERQKQLWVQQQKQIAATVSIVPDNTDFSGDDVLISIPLPEDEAMLIGGTDVSFPATPEAPAVAVYTILRGRHVVYCQHLFFQLELPYIPGFLAFREIEPLVQLVSEQQRKCPELTPSVILVDGNGTWHERSAGLASVLGVRLNLPTIGVGKTFYNLGDWHKGLLEPVICNSLQLTQCSTTKMNKKDEFMLWRRQPLDESNAESLDGCDIETKKESMKILSRARGLAIALVTTKTTYQNLAQCCILVGHGGSSGVRHEVPSAKPIFISVGHKISLRQAVAIVCKNCYVRIPEAIRQADLRGRELMRHANG